MYTAEFEFNCSTGLLYPYLNTAGGLQQWFAEDVRIKRNKILSMTIDGEEYHIEFANEKPNKQVRIEFLDEDLNREEEPYFIEFAVDFNEMTGSTYLTIVDDSGLFETEDEFLETWEGLISQIRAIIKA